MKMGCTYFCHCGRELRRGCTYFCQCGREGGGCIYFCHCGREGGGVSTFAIVVEKEGVYLLLPQWHTRKGGVPTFATVVDKEWGPRVLLLPLVDKERCRKERGCTYFATAVDKERKSGYIYYCIRQEKGMYLLLPQWW